MTTKTIIRVDIIDGTGGNGHFLSEVVRSQTESLGVCFTIMFCMGNGTSEHCLIHLRITSAESNNGTDSSFRIEGFDNDRSIKGVYDTHTRKGYFEYV